MQDTPLTRQDLKFVNKFRHYRDIYKAAEYAGISKNRAKRTYERIEIQEEIERQDNALEHERARVTVEAEGITKNFLDARLLQLINLDVRKQSGAVQRALELGYVRAGVLQVGNTRSLDLTPPNPDDDSPLPTVYQALFTVGVSAPATPIVPAEAPSAPSKEFQARVRELTTPPPPPAPVPPAPVPGAIKAGRIKIG